MSDDLVKRLDNLWAMLEEEGYYVKANTAELAKNRIEELEDHLRMAMADREAARAKLDSAVAGLTEAIQQFRVIAGMDLMGASSVAYSAARDAERICAMMEEQTDE